MFASNTNMSLPLHHDPLYLNRCFRWPQLCVTSILKVCCLGPVSPSATSVLHLLSPFHLAPYHVDEFTSAKDSVFLPKMIIEKDVERFITSIAFVVAMHVRVRLLDASATTDDIYQWFHYPAQGQNLKLNN
jgi:hypothetical protein